MNNKILTEPAPPRYWDVRRVNVGYALLVSIIMIIASATLLWRTFSMPYSHFALISITAAAIMSFIISLIYLYNIFKRYSRNHGLLGFKISSNSKYTGTELILPTIAIIASSLILSAILLYFIISTAALPPIDALYMMCTIAALLIAACASIYNLNKCHKTGELPKSLSDKIIDKAKIIQATTSAKAAQSIENAGSLWSRIKNFFKSSNETAGEALEQVDRAPTFPLSRQHEPADDSKSSVPTNEPSKASRDAPVASVEGCTEYTDTNNSYHMAQTRDLRSSSYTNKNPENYSAQGSKKMTFDGCSHATQSNRIEQFESYPIAYSS